MKKILKPLLTLAAITFLSTATAQDNISADSIDGIYIPVDIKDALREIDGYLDDSTKNEARAMPSGEFTGLAHLGFGMWLRNNWGLWGGSRLSVYFNDMGIYHPDDMSGIILRSYYRHLHGKRVNVQKETGHYKRYRNNSAKQRLKEARKELSRYQTGTVVFYTYPYGWVSEKEETSHRLNICTPRGIITGKDPRKGLIKIRLTETCDERGILSFSPYFSRTFDEQGESVWKDDEEFNVMQLGEEEWFSVFHWIMVWDAEF